MAYPGVGKGTTLAVAGSTAWSGVVEVLAIRHTGRSRNVVDTTYLGTANNYRTKIPGGFVDPGALEIDVHFNPNIGDNVPITVAASTEVKITFPDAETLKSKGFVTTEGFEVPLDDKMTGTVTIELTGAPTWTS